MSARSTDAATDVVAAQSLPIIAHHFMDAPGLKYAFRDDELPYVISASAFREHLEGLASEGLSAVRLEQYLNRALLPARPVVFTFDDGHVSFHDVAMGLLAEYDCTATLFMVADFVGKPGYLTRDQLAELSQRGIEIGSHGCSHRPLTAMPVAEMKDEVRRSKGTLEDITGRAVAVLALPHGFGSRAVEQAAREAGYEAICTSRFGLNGVPRSSYCLNRVSVKNPLPWSSLEALIQPESPAYQQALIKDRMKAAAKWIVQTHKRC